MEMIYGIEVLCHSAIRIKKDNIIIYIDPYNIKENYNDADYIFITHEHYDHFSPEDIEKVIKSDTVIISVPKVISAVENLQKDKTKLICVEPNESYDLKNIKFETTVAYNKTKLFHQKSKKWVGYIIIIEGVRYYIAGDTDDLDELENIKCDVAFVPIGGMYTMDYKAAANLINQIKPKYAIPVHYGSIIGNKEDAEEFRKKVNKDITVIEKIKCLNDI